MGEENGLANALSPAIGESSGSGMWKQTSFESSAKYESSDYEGDYYGMPWTAFQPMSMARAAELMPKAADEDSQDELGNGTGRAPSTSSQDGSSSLKAVSEHDSASPCSIPDPSLAGNNPPMTAQTQEDTQKHQLSSTGPLDSEGKSQDVPPTIILSKKKAKAEKAKKDQQKSKALQNHGPNRKQRRATEREEKAAEKKAQAAAAAAVKERKARAGVKKGRKMPNRGSAV